MVLIRKARTAVALCAALFLVASPALAQKPCSAADRKAAEQLANKGFELYEASDYAAAADHFGRAEQQCHSPRLLIFAGKSEVRLGKLLHAREVFEKAAGEVVTSRSPPSFREAQIEARKEIEALKPRIPTLQILVTGAPPDSVQMKLDGQPVPVADLQHARELDPGEHTVTADAPGMEPFVRHLTLREGVSERIELALRAPAPRGAEPANKPTAAGPNSGTSVVPPAAAFGVAALGIGIGAVTGIISANKVADIESRCIEGNQCLTTDEAEADTAKTLGTVSTIGFIVGGVFLAGGVTLLVIGDGSPAVASSTRAVQVGVGLGSVRVGGSF
jgi:hypothetical protein